MARSEHRWLIRLDGSSLPDKELPDRALIGGKAWSVARMMALGLPVPPAFVITTAACRAFLATGKMPEGLREDLAEGIRHLERATGETFGAGPRPLLVSVRSGAPISMPGMMDTVLNLGITPDTETAIAARCGDPAFARDTHRRFFDLYSHIVMKAGIDGFDPAAGPADWAAQVQAASGRAMPETVQDRLLAAVIAVFESWNGRRARRYRAHHGIPDDLGTAVTVQAMVFGNMDDASGTGVLFSRNPLTGDPAPFGEYLARAQGEDVVSGKFTPQPLDAMKETAPEAHAALLHASDVLERENGDVQDIEFTVQSGRLYLLQSRAAKRAPAAAVRFATDMVDEGRIDIATALSRVSPEQVRLLLAPRLARDPGPEAEVLASGEGASPGVGRGIVVTDADAAETQAAAGADVVLARPTTSPEDVHGMIVACAVVTETGGSTSHAAVVGRALGLPSVVGCGTGVVAALAGRAVTVDGGRGKVYAGLLEVERPDETADPRLMRLIDWARAVSPLPVWRPAELAALPAPPPEVTDLSQIDGGEDPDRIGSVLAGLRAARGGAIASDEGIRAALAAGLDLVVADPVLPPLLAAIQSAGATTDN